MFAEAGLQKRQLPTIDPHFLLWHGVLAGTGFPGSWAAGGVHVTSPSQGDVDKVKHPTSRSTQNSPAVLLVLPCLTADSDALCDLGNYIFFI